MNERVSVISGIPLLEAWEEAKKASITKKQFAKSLGITPKSLENRRYKAKKKRERQQSQDQQQETVTDITEGNYRTVIAHGTRHQSVEDLLAHLKIDMTVWQIDGKFEVGSWEQGRRAEKKKLHWAGGRIEHGDAEDTGKLFIDTLHRFKVPLVRIIPIAITPTVKPVQFIIKSVTDVKPISRNDAKKVLLIPDLHVGYRRNFETGELIPYHDRHAMNIVLQVAQSSDFDAVVYLGDLLDLSEWTDKFVKEPEFYKTTQPALIECSWFLAQMKNALPEAEHTILLGNHEKRFEIYMMQQHSAAYGLKPATELLLDEPLSIQRMLGLETLDINLSEPYPNGEVWYNGLRCIHGSLVSGIPGGSATKVINRATCTTAFGHVHRLELTTKTVHDESGIRYIFAASVGCLCRIDYTVPGHKRGQNWQQGFGVAHLNDSARIELIPIFNRGAFYNGKHYRAYDYTNRLKEDTDYKF